MATNLTQPLTQDQWLEKLQSWIPGWYFSDDADPVNGQDSDELAHAKAVALVLSQEDQNVFDHVCQTFIEFAEEEVLDQIGNDRNVPRLPNELDAQYRIRIRNIDNNSDCPSLKTIIDSILLAGTATIVEDYNSLVFCNREQFYNRGELFIDRIENAYSIQVDKQVHPPYSYMNREYFMNRDDYIGTTLSSQYVFDLILQIVKDNKAVGTLFRVLEKVGS